MNLDELVKALDRIPDEGEHNKAKRAEIIKQIIALQKEKVKKK